MSAFSHPYLLGSGALLLLLGIWLWRWSSRHDLKGMAVDAAWQVAKARGDLKVETELGNRIKDVTADASHTGKAKKAAGYAVRHALAQVASLVSLAAIIGGAALIAAAFYLR